MSQTIFSNSSNTAELGPLTLVVTFAGFALLNLLLRRIFTQPIKTLNPSPSRSSTSPHRPRSIQPPSASISSSSAINSSGPSTPNFFQDSPRKPNVDRSVYFSL